MCGTGVRTHFQGAIHAGEIVVATTEKILAFPVPGAIVGADTLTAISARIACVALTDSILQAAAVVAARIRAIDHATIQASVVPVAETVSIWLARAEPGTIVHATSSRACRTSVSLP